MRFIDATMIGLRAFAAVVRRVMDPIRRRQMLDAVAAGNVPEVANLLAKGVSPELRNESNRTLLERAIFVDSAEIFELLAAHGALLDPIVSEPGVFEFILHASDERWRDVLLSHVDVAASYAPKLAELAFASISKPRARAVGVALLKKVQNRGVEPSLRALLGSQPAALLDCDSADYRDVFEFLRLAGLLHKVRTRHGEGALRAALAAGRADVARSMLEAGEGVDALLDNGSPPVLVAAEHGLDSLYERLLVHSATHDAAEDLCLHDAIDEANVAMVLKALRRGANPDALRAGYRALTLALEARSESIAALLITFGATSDAVDREGYPPLARASDMQSVGLVRLLLWRGCGANDAGDETRFGTLPLMAAVRAGNSSIVDALISAGAEVNARSWGGETAFTYASLLGNESAVDALARAGADLNVQSAEGWTALHWAAFGKRNDVCERLVELGVDIDRRDKSGRTALDLAMRDLAFPVSQILRKLGLKDAYSAEASWSDGVERGRFDYFISYRQYRFKDTAMRLAHELRAGGCEVYLDADDSEIEALRLRDNQQHLPPEELRRLLFVAIRSSTSTLFFESTLEQEVVARTGSGQLAFSWTLFEQLHSDRWRLLRSMPTASELRELISDAMAERGR